MVSKTVIMVTGATGMAGAEVCRQLIEHPGLEVRAALHTPDKQRLLPAGVIPVPFDTDDPATVDAALAGVDKLFLATPGGPIGPPATRVITEAARRHRLRAIVKLSSIAPELEPQAPTDLWALESEAMVRATGIPYTFLRPPWFDQNFSKGYFAPMVAERTLALPFGAGRAAWIDSRDVAAIAVKALTEDGFAGEVITPTGPEAISLAEIAAALTAAAGHEIRFRPLTDAEWLANSQAAGYPEAVARAMLALIAKTRDGYTSLVNDEVERLTGRKARSFATFARDHSLPLGSLAGSSRATGDH